MKILSWISVLMWANLAFAQNFLPATEDIPLMDGLYQVEETATFDSPSEKMTIISAISHKKPQHITQYYHQVLTNLGWVDMKNNHYIRGSDDLTLEISTAKETIVQFTLVQKN